MKVTTAVFPVAGLGTRFLPVTKAGPKEMLPIVDQPLIQYVVEEAIQAGIKQLVFVTSSNKRSIEDYFDSNFELEAHLVEKNKLEVLKTVQNILPKDVQAVYIRQPHPLGLGDAVLRAKGVVGDRAFAVLLADDIVDCDIKSCIHQMIEVYEATHSSVIGVENIPREDTDKYGIVSLGDKQIAGANLMTAVVEKPKPEVAASTLAVAGRYILTPRIFSLLEMVTQGVGGEIQLTDALAQLLNYEEVYAYPFKGTRYDCGTRIGFLEATIAYALKRPDLKDKLINFMKRQVA